MMRITPKWSKRIKDGRFKHVPGVVSVPRVDPETPAVDADESDGFPFQETDYVPCCGRSFLEIIVERPRFLLSSNRCFGKFDTDNTGVLFSADFRTHSKKLYAFLTIWEVQSESAGGWRRSFLWNWPKWWWRSTLVTQDVPLFFSCFFFTGFSTEEKAWLELIWLPLFPKGWVIVLQLHFLMDEVFTSLTCKIQRMLWRSNARA